MDAAKYQMLITYLIGTCSFGTILSEVFLVRTIAFDKQTQMLRTDRFLKRETKLSFLGRIATIGSFLQSVWKALTTLTRVQDGTSYDETMGETQPLSSWHNVDLEYVAPKGSIEILTVRSGGTNEFGTRGSTSVATLEIRQVSRTFPANEKGTSARTLFYKLSKTISSGDIVVVQGPSGVGKTQLLRLIAGLSPMDNDAGDLLLEGLSRNEFQSPSQWRRQIRYVSQYKVDIPGTPEQFIQRVSSCHSWKYHDMPTFQDIVSSSSGLIKGWGLDATYLEKEWKVLSGGESQRVYLAIAIASRPRVLLLDESTSALDFNSKILVEESVEAAAKESGISVLWITHDEDQVKRMKHCICALVA
jgi:ABC-type iron transport system FetAB ATPase subunit